VRFQLIETPLRLAIPFGELSGLKRAFPVQLVEDPVGFDRVRAHRNANPVRFVVDATASNRNDVVDCWVELPPHLVALAHLPVALKGKLLREPQRQEPEGAGEHEPMPFVTIDTTVSQKDPDTLRVCVAPSSRDNRNEWVLLSNERPGLVVTVAA
jgi:hypothetical protein